MGALRSIGFAGEAWNSNPSSDPLLKEPYGFTGSAVANPDVETRLSPNVVGAMTVEQMRTKNGAPNDLTKMIMEGGYRSSNRSLKD